jgi:glycosyltransferase involved in cell wall biosynthesis
MPLFSIVTPVYNPPLDVLRDTIRSVREQTFADWEWILVDDCSPDAGVLQTLHAAAEQDPRIRVVQRAQNGHIVAASNDGLAAAVGEFLVFVDHDDLLVKTALERMAEEIAAHPDADYLYSDEDKAEGSSEDGTLRFFGDFPKPDWSPERLRGQMYASHLSVVRHSVLDRVGGFREGYEGSQDHDLILRVTEQARDVVHIPEVLYHWRLIPGSAAGDSNAKPYARIAGMRAVQDSLDRLGILGTVVPVPTARDCYRIVRRLPAARRVSIVIPTRGDSGLIWGAERTFVVETVRSVLQTGAHDEVEFVVVADSSTPSDVTDRLQEMCGSSLVLVPYSKPFNFSEKMNLGVVHASGESIVSLNDDIQPISDHWLQQLLGPLEEPDVGMTGAKLFFSDGTIQHGGHKYDSEHFHHPYLGANGDNLGAYGELVINHEVSGVTAACAGFRRDVFFEVGGFSETLPINFNDVDLSYKIRRAGYRIVWVANCELYHFESRTRVRGIEPWELAAARARWGYPARDDYMRLA